MNSAQAAYGSSADTLTKVADTIGSGNDSQMRSYDLMRPSHYFSFLANNFKHQATAPFNLRPKEWTYLGAFAIVTGATMFVDQPLNDEAFSFTEKHNGFRKVSDKISSAGGVYQAITLGVLGSTGIMLKNEKLVNTTLLASQAFVTSSVWGHLFKKISGRERPSRYIGQGKASPAFRGPFSDLGRDRYGEKLTSSFPSGHTIVAFSAATVYAMEYSDKPLIPVISYAAAGIMGASRIISNQHWFSDVLVGATLGHVYGRQVVRNYRRRTTASDTEHEQKLSVTLGYNSGMILPALTYRLNGR
ncbi:MAG TPA: phosphatase PAP2 family protein [Sphingobacteriaceae bacterium]